MIKPLRTIGSFFRNFSRRGKWLLLAAVTLAVLPVLAELRILEIKRMGDDVAIAFQAEQGVTYRLERKTNLTTSAWQSISGVNDVTATSNGPVQVTDPGGSGLGQAFYRVNASRGIYVDVFD